MKLQHGVDYLVSIGIVLAAVHLTDAVQARNNNAVYYCGFIFGLHLPLTLIIMGVINLLVVPYYKKKYPHQNQVQHRNLLPGQLVQPNMTSQVQVANVQPSLQPTSVQHTQVKPATLQKMSVQSSHVKPATILQVQPANPQPVTLQLTPAQRAKAHAATFQQAKVQPTNSQPVTLQQTPAQRAKAQAATLQPAQAQHTNVQPTPIKPLRTLPKRPTINRPKTQLWKGGPYTVPRYWQPTTTPHEIDYPELTSEADFIKYLVYSLWDSEEVGKGRDAKPLSPHVYIDIHGVKRVQNIGMFQWYLSKKKNFTVNQTRANYYEDMKRFAGGPVLTTSLLTQNQNTQYSYLEDEIDHPINEHYLFHGTRSNHVEEICRRGLSVYYASQGMFGTGIYTADNPTKSDQYTDQTVSGDNILLLCRVLLGDTYVQRDVKNASQLNYPPCRVCFLPECKVHGQKTFNSVVTKVQGMRFTEYIVYEDNRIYPEYIIKYRRVADDSKMKEIIETYAS